MTLRLGIAGVRHPHVDLLVTAALGRPDLVRIVALAEDDPALRDRYARRLDPGVRLYADHRAMLAHERLDVAGVAAINAARGDIVRDCLVAGLHVIADKPLCTTLDDLAAIEAAWRAGDRHLTVMLEKRGWAATLGLRALLRDGTLGVPALAWASSPHRLRPATRPEWMFDRACYGGILNDLAVHDIDLLLWFSGARAGEVQGLTGNRANRDRLGFEDVGQVYLRADDGPLATLEVHWYSPEAAPYHGDYRLVLTGTSGTAEVRWAQGELHVATHTAPPRLVDLVPPRAIVEDFFSALVSGTAPPIGTEEVLTASRVALLAQATANDGAWHRWTAVRPR